MQVSWPSDGELLFTEDLAVATQAHNAGRLAERWGVSGGVPAGPVTFSEHSTVS